MASPIDSDSTPSNDSHVSYVNMQDSSPTKKKTTRREKVLKTALALLCTTLQRAFKRKTRLRLLDLPPELRNQIWRYVLHEQNAIPVSSSASQQPALLRTCHQITRETRGIFHNENTFRITVIDLKMTVPRQHWLETVVTEPYARDFYLIGNLNASNLMQWCKMRHGGNRVCFRVGGLNDPCRQVVAGAMNIVDELAAVGTKWEVVERVLNQYRPAVCAGRRGLLMWTRSLG
ncbi:hypothetical protein LTR10_007145 [Elasticomyces elasticus]|nr:hypothetical protein LTR10_007145 [Elasticomyces elasticus]KAK4978962.1 hypothetical protein LTR42_001462 [Elasticomyces elasticus]